MNNADDSRKQSLYSPAGMLLEIRSEAKRLDRPLSYMVQRAWKVARKAIRESQQSTIFPDEKDH